MKIQIQADKVNNSGVKVVKGQTVSVTVDPHLIWTDLTIRTNANGYKSDNLLQELVSPLKDCPSANWFTLCAKINKHVFPVGCDGSFVAPETGDLYFLANDLSWMRWNNFGKLELTLDIS